MSWLCRMRMKRRGELCQNCAHYHGATGSCIVRKPTRVSGRIVERWRKCREVYGTELCEWEQRR